MKENKNVILVTVDSIRYDRCGFSGNTAVSTPTLDEMAKEGLHFKNGIAPGSGTPDSVPVSLTGEFPPLKTNNDDLDQWVRDQSGARRTLAERFSAHGYRTGAFTANPWTSRFFGFNKGFDSFEDFFVDDESNRLLSEAISEDSFVMEAVRNINDWLKGQNMFMSWEAFYDDIIEWTENTNEPYFLWVFLVDVHMPYYAGSEYRTQSKLMLLPANLWLFLSGLHDTLTPFDDILWEAYDNCIRHTDEFLRRLREDTASDDPLIAVHGDHGDEFGEFGRYGHGSGLSEGLIHVPFVIENGPRGEINEVVSLKSLPEILVDVATDQSSESDVNWDDEVALSWIGQTVSLRTNRWKYVRDMSSEEKGDLYRIDSSTCSEELWRDCPGEVIEVIDELAEVAYSDRLEKKRIADAAEDLAGEGEL